MRRISSLVLLVLAFWPSSASAGGSFSFTHTLLPLLQDDPTSMGQILLGTFDFQDSGSARRIGSSVNENLAGTRVGPYEISARPKESEGDYIFDIEIETEITYYDDQLNETTINRAASIEERIIGFSIKLLNQPVKAPEPPKTVAKLTINVEDGAKIPVRVELKKGRAIVKTWEVDAPTTESIVISSLPDAQYLIYCHSNGYASRWNSLKVSGGFVDPAIIDATLYRKRYVTIRWAFRQADDSAEFPSLQGPEVKSGRTTISHWEQLPFFGEDWFIWQSEEDMRARPGMPVMFGKTPWLAFHRYSSDFGFAEPKRGTEFDEMIEPPPDYAYRCNDYRVEEGLVLYCRVNGNSGNLGYGKILVERVSETPDE